MKFTLLAKTLQEYGLKWAVWRGVYALAMKSGHFRRGLHTGQDPVAVLAQKMGGPDDEAAPWLADRWHQDKGAFFLDVNTAMDQLPADSRRALTEGADAILQGRFPLFSRTQERGFPPNWFQGEADYPAWPHDVHWTRIADLGRDNGDIKHLWELSRFTHAFELSRAYLCTGDEKYAEGFWALCESWWANNPLEMGPNWRCGQELSFRIMAWTFALHALQNAQASTPHRVGTLIAHLWHHGRHVQKVNWYAEKCVRNNHAISEAVALRSLGLLFPFLPEAEHWRQRSRRSLDNELAWQIYTDGTYVQQSNNYARLVVQLLSWAINLERANGADAADLEFISGKARLLVNQLLTQLAGRQGELPNYGSNDGTLLLPWSAASYRDYRPALHALCRTLGEAGLPGTGPWQQESVWFGLPLEAAADAPQSVIPAPKSIHNFPRGGLNVMRGTDSLVLFRCGPNAHRPAEADMLHVDYWHKGVNILLDAGTFGYNVAPEVRDYFAGTRSHNTVTVGGVDQMQRGSRFLWHNWVQGQAAAPVDNEAKLAGRHQGYRPFVHLREVHLKNDCLLVVDDLTGGASATDLRLHWLLPEGQLQETPQGLQLELPTGEQFAVKIWCDQPCVSDIVCDRAAEPRGVWSSHYGVMAPAVSLATTAKATAARFVTFVGPADALDRLQKTMGTEPDATSSTTPAAALNAWQDITNL